MDAYTLRKIAPRILIGVIGINLSIYLCIAAIDITEVIGSGLHQLITTPFNVGNDLNTSPGGSSATGAVLALGTISGLSVAAGIAGAGTILLALLMIMLFGIAILVVLAIRQALLVLLTILSPVAIALFILPNTERYFRQWWELFIKTLMVYPIVSALFAISNVMVSLKIDDAEGGALLDVTTAIIFAFAPLFLIPFAFRFAGGAMAGIMNAANAPMQKLNRARQQRASKTMRERYDKATGAGIWDRNSKVGRAANKAMSYAVSPHQNVAYNNRNRRFIPGSSKTGIPGIRKYGYALGSKVQGGRVEQSSALLKKLNETGMFNDKGYRALAGLYGGFSDETKTKLQGAGFMDSKGGTVKAPKSVHELQTMSNILAQSSSDTERIAGSAIAGSTGTIATAYNDPELHYADTQAAGLMGLASHGFADDKDIAEGATLLSAGGKDMDYGQAVGLRASVMGQSQRPDIKAGYGLLRDAESGEFKAVTDDPARAEALIKTAKQQDWVQAKSPAISNLHPHIVKLASQTDASGNLTEDAKALHDQIMLGASTYSSGDIGAKTEWRKIESELKQKGIDLEPKRRQIEEQERLMMEQQRGSTGGSSGGGDAGGGGGDAGGGGGE